MSAPRRLSLRRACQAIQGYKHQHSRSDRWAGVAVILRPAPTEELDVLLIRRSENPNDPWSGHMAMPGGRQDPGDISVQAAAERETLEEVNVDLRRDARLLGQLDEVRAVARGREVGLSVAPFVYLLETAVTPQPNEEVQEALWVPLADLASEQYRSTRPYEWQGTRLLLPAWRWQDRVIWGLTYQMLQSLLRIIEQAWTEEPPD